MKKKKEPDTNDFYFSYTHRHKKLASILFLILFYIKFSLRKTKCLNKKTALLSLLFFSFCFSDIAFFSKSCAGGEQNTPGKLFVFG